MNDDIKVVSRENRNFHGSFLFFRHPKILWWRSGSGVQVQVRYLLHCIKIICQWAWVDKRTPVVCNILLTSDSPGDPISQLRTDHSSWRSAWLPFLRSLDISLSLSLSSLSLSLRGLIIMASNWTLSWCWSDQWHCTGDSETGWYRYRTRYPGAARDNLII